MFHSPARDEAALVEQLKGAEAIVLTMQRTEMPRSVIEKLPALKMISQTGRNTGHLDLVDDSRCFPLRDQGASRSTPSFRGVDGWGETSVADAVEALEAVYANPDEAARRAANAAAWMRGLSWDAQIDKLHDAIRDLI